MSERSRRTRLQLPEERPLLQRNRPSHSSEIQVPLYGCMANPHSHLPVYTNIHRIRRDITSIVEDYLSLEQLRDVRINIAVVRPLVDKLYELDDISIGMDLPHCFKPIMCLVEVEISAAGEAGDPAVVLLKLTSFP
ncbi:nonselective cation channel [Colletotrichum tofieldiae]|nr:nonselective cation channel [Colletotrichum tofieldiae]